MMLSPAEVCFPEVGGSRVNPGPQRCVFPQTHSDSGIPVRQRAENTKPSNTIMSQEWPTQVLGL